MASTYQEELTINNLTPLSATVDVVVKKIPVPSLSTDGWIYNTDTKLRKLFGFFMMSLAGQSTNFNGNVRNIKEIMALNLESELTASRISDSLRALLVAYFDTVDLAVEIVDLEDNNNNGMQFLLTVTDENGTANLSSVYDMSTINSQIELIGEV